MSKAEELADTIICKKCPNSQDKYKVCGMRKNKEFCVKTQGFILGYEQALKDLMQNRSAHFVESMTCGGQATIKIPYKGQVGDYVSIIILDKK